MQIRKRVIEMGGDGIQGKQREKVSKLSGIGTLEELTTRKQFRWAASVYSRCEEELRPVAERILREELGEDVILRWRNGG